MGNFFYKFLRFFVQVFFFVFEWLLTLVEGIQRPILGLFFKPQYVRKGGCQMTGQCCQAIGMELPGFWFRYPRLVRLVQKWHELRYHFEAHGRQDNMLVYSCHYLTEDNRCGIQRFKPKLCRDYPKTEFLGFTKLHKGCGFYFEKRVGKDFGKVMRNRRENISEVQEITTSGGTGSYYSERAHEVGVSELESEQ